jgi:hypothetical protein
MLVVLYVVFSSLMRIQVEHYQLFLLLGIILWNFLDRGTSMSKIEEKIQARMGPNVLPKSEDMPVDKISKKSRELEYINSNWDIHNNNYSISSHRRILGTTLITGRELVHREVQLYIDPVIWMQREFNSSIVKIFNNIIELLGRISYQVEGKIAESQSRDWRSWN